MPILAVLGGARPLCGRVSTAGRPLCITIIGATGTAGQFGSHQLINTETKKTKTNCTVSAYCIWSNSHE